MARLLTERIAVAEGPPALIAWLEALPAPAHGDEESEAIGACDRADWLVWILANVGVPIPGLVHCLADYAKALASSFTGHADALEYALQTSLEAAEGDAAVEDCLEALDIVESLVAEPPAGYRTTEGHGFTDAARSVCEIVGAAAALTAAYNISTIERDAAARRRAALVGGGLFAAGQWSAFYDRAEALRLNATALERDPVQPPLLEVVRRLARAIQLHVAARLAREQHGEALEELSRRAHREIAQAMIAAEGLGLAELGR